MNGLTVSFLLVGIYMMSCFCNAIPLATNQQKTQRQIQGQRESESDPISSPDFDYSRFYFGNNNLGFYDKKSLQAPNFGAVPSQWYASSLSRQLAPKFKRNFGSYEPHDKRLDEQLFDEFYMNMKPDRYEWNFNRL